MIPNFTCCVIYKVLQHDYLIHVYLVQYTDQEFYFSRTRTEETEFIRSWEAMWWTTLIAGLLSDKT